MKMIKVRKLDQIISWMGSRVLRWNVARAAALRWSSATVVESPENHPALTLYDFEGSPWCRLVREYATILDLPLEIRPCPRETLLYGEGAFSSKSRFRSEAMNWYQTKYPNCDHLTFPLLVDQTNHKNKNKNKTITPPKNNYKIIDNNDDNVVIINESYDILCHLWEQYGSTVIPTTTTDDDDDDDNNSNNNKVSHRPDQMMNSSSLPFIIRFLSLAGPSYLRPWPRCGVMRFPSLYTASIAKITLYGSEGCPESRLVREVLCSLEIPYRSVPVADGSSNALPIIQHHTMYTNDDAPIGNGNNSSSSNNNNNNNNMNPPIQIPILEVDCTVSKDKDNSYSSSRSSKLIHRIGAKECVDYLRDTYYDDQNQTTTSFYSSSSNPTWFDLLPKENLGRSDDSSNSVAIGAYTAFLKGTRSFVPEKAMK
jgi:hypothetical protein